MRTCFRSLTGVPAHPPGAALLRAASRNGVATRRPALLAVLASDQANGSCTATLVPLLAQAGPSVGLSYSRGFGGRTLTRMQNPPASRETAYYYPEPFWMSSEGGWVKALLLFFDEVSILLPSYMRGRHLLADPWLAESLEERGLLRVLEPETFIDEEAANELTALMEALIEGDAFGDLPQVGHLAELSMSRMGYGALREVAARIFDKLRARGLAQDSQDGWAIPLHPHVRSVYLLLLAQLSRGTGARQGLDLHPVRNWRGSGDAVHRLLDLEPMPSRGHVVAFDLEVVGLDLDDVPLDDVLQFKQESASAHRAYMHNLRQFTLELGLMDEMDRAKALKGRRADLQDQASDLRRRAYEAWHRPKAVAGFALGITGAAWSVSAGSAIPAALTLLGAGLNMLPDKADGAAYSYLFDAHRALN